MVAPFEFENKGEVLGILVGGGPAPGINGVIRAATIEAINSGLRVVGIIGGFHWLARGDNSKIWDLTISDVSRIHFRGGSILRTSRVNPAGSKEAMSNTLRALRNLEVDYLLTIGGDDTAYSALNVAEATNNHIRVVHVPKTIDNDLPLPGTLSTFGYQTARHVGVELIHYIMVDAQTTSRWYFVVSMGRKAGHLALGIARAASATLAIIAEEFRGRKVHLDELVDILAGAIIKRRAMGKNYGVAVLAEGLTEQIAEEDLLNLEEVERDDHGHIRYSEIPLGEIIRNAVRKRLRERGIGTKIVSKNIGYELRCADPIPFDCEYTQDLGHAAVRYLLEGGSGAMVTLQAGRSVPLPLNELINEETGRMTIRAVDVDSDSYKVARKYMIRLDQEDFVDPNRMRRLARAGRMTPEEFENQFSHLGKPW
jgi:6-phosphofructokinase 1